MIVLLAQRVGAMDIVVTTNADGGNGIRCARPFNSTNSWAEAIPSFFPTRCSYDPSR